MRQISHRIPVAVPVSQDADDAPVRARFKGEPSASAFSRPPALSGPVPQPLHHRRLSRGIETATHGGLSAKERYHVCIHQRPIGEP
jgi:hypothetical protein